jgi:hypothetical protein
MIYKESAKSKKPRKKIQHTTEPFGFFCVFIYEEHNNLLIKECPLPSEGILYKNRVDKLKIIYIIFTDNRVKNLKNGVGLWLRKR